MAGVLDILGGVFRPLVDLVEHIIPSGDAKIKVQQQIIQAQIDVAMRTMDYEKQLLEAQSSIIKAEALGASWMQRNWRPVTMLTFLVLTVADAFGWLPFRLADQAWALLQVGLGGYVAGRSLEKIAPAIAGAIAKK